jgi:hypothetical protein
MLLYVITTFGRKALDLAALSTSIITLSIMVLWSVAVTHSDVILCYGITTFGLKALDLETLITKHRNTECHGLYAELW